MKKFFILGMALFAMTQVARAEDIADDLDLEFLGKSTIIVDKTNVKLIEANASGLKLVLERDEGTNAASTYCELVFNKDKNHKTRYPLETDVPLNGDTKKYKPATMIDLVSNHPDFSVLRCAVADKSSYKLNGKLIKEALAIIGARVEQAPPSTEESAFTGEADAVTGAGSF